MKSCFFFYDQQGNRVGMADSSNHFYYYIYNLQGDVIALADGQTGKLVATYTYDAWGKCTVKNATGFTIGTENPFRYRGYYYDSETELYYLNSRYYDAETGRFINADKYTTTGQGMVGNNMFAYCNNNPIANKDSYGNFCLPAAIIGGVINAGFSMLCTIIDASDNIKEIDYGAMMIDAAASFAFGFISSGLETNMYDNALLAAEAGYSFLSTVSNGGTVKEAVIETATTVVSSKASGKLTGSAFGGTKKEIAASAGESVVSSIVDTAIRTVTTIGKSVFDLFFGTSHKNKNVNSNREVKICALGA